MGKTPDEHPMFTPPRVSKFSLKDGESITNGLMRELDEAIASDGGDRADVTRYARVRREEVDWPDSVDTTKAALVLIIDFPDDEEADSPELPVKSYFLSKIPPAVAAHLLHDFSHTLRDVQVHHAEQN